MRRRQSGEAFTETVQRLKTHTTPVEFVAVPSSSTELPPIALGSVGGACSAICAYPFDTLKVRAQAMTAGASPARGLGLLGIYKGVQTPLLTVTPIWALLYWGYRKGSETYGPDDGEWHWQRSALGGIVAGFSASFVFTPMQAVKSVVQVHRCSILEATRMLYAHGGLRNGIYRGYGPALAYELPGFAAFFTVYDYLLLNDDRPELTKVVGAAAVASFAESTFGMPGDTVKTRYQTNLSYKSVYECMQTLYRTEGARGFYRGYRFRLVYGAVQNAAALVPIEALRRVWKEW